MASDYAIIFDHPDVRHTFRGVQKLPSPLAQGPVFFEHIMVEVIDQLLIAGAKGSVYRRAFAHRLASMRGYASPFKDELVLEVSIYGRVDYLLANICYCIKTETQIIIYHMVSPSLRMHLEDQVRAWI
jgi:hypothetical protein